MSNKGGVTSATEKTGSDDEISDERMFTHPQMAADEARNLDQGTFLSRHDETSMKMRMMLGASAPGGPKQNAGGPGHAAAKAKAKAGGYSSASGGRNASGNNSGGYTSAERVYNNMNGIPQPAGMGQGRGGNFTSDGGQRTSAGEGYNTNYAVGGANVYGSHTG